MPAKLRAMPAWRYSAQPLLLVVLAEPAVLGFVWLSRWAADGAERAAESRALSRFRGPYARQRDRGFSWWQWWIMTPLTVMGAFWVTSVLSGLPMFLLVLYAQLTR